MHSFHIWHKSSLASEGVSHVMTFDLWPIFSRSFSLDLENRVRFVASTVLDGFFPYLVQMITSMRRCVACDFYLDFENRIRTVTFSVLDRYFFWLGIQYDSIVWVIKRWRGVSSERRRSSCSSLSLLCKYSLVVIIDIYFVKQLVHINRKRTHETSLLAIFKGNQFVSKRALIRKMYHCYHVIMHIFCPTAIADGPQGQPPSPYERHFGSDEGEWAQSSAIL